MLLVCFDFWGVVHERVWKRCAAQHDNNMKCHSEEIAFVFVHYWNQTVGSVGEPLQSGRFLSKLPPSLILFVMFYAYVLHYFIIVTSSQALLCVSSEMYING